MCGYKFYCETEKDFIKKESYLLKKGYFWKYIEGSAINIVDSYLPCWFYTENYYIWRSTYEKCNLKLLKIKHVWI